MRMAKQDKSEPVPTTLVMAFGGKGVGDHVFYSSFLRNLAKNRPGHIIDLLCSALLGTQTGNLVAVLA